MNPSDLVRAIDNIEDLIEQSSSYAEAGRDFPTSGAGSLEEQLMHILKILRGENPPLNV